MKPESTPLGPLGDPTSPVFWLTFLAANAGCLVLFGALFL